MVTWLSVAPVPDLRDTRLEVPSIIYVLLKLVVRVCEVPLRAALRHVAQRCSWRQVLASDIYLSSPLRPPKLIVRVDGACWSCRA